MFFFIKRERWNRQLFGNHLGDRAFSCSDRSDEYDRFHYREYIRPCAAPHIEFFKKSASCSAFPLNLKNVHLTTFLTDRFAVA